MRKRFDMLILLTYNCYIYAVQAENRLERMNKNGKIKSILY